MVFTTTNLFKGIACPVGPQCTLTHCVFSHESESGETGAQQTTSIATVSAEEQAKQHSNEQTPEPPTKRRKMIYGTLKDKSPSRAEQIRSQLAAARIGKQRDSHTIQGDDRSSNTSPEQDRVTLHSLSSLSRPVSPPTAAPFKRPPSIAKTRQAEEAVAATQPPSAVLRPVKRESLNPRLVPQAPDSHNKRTLYVQHLHSNMARLNRELQDRPAAVNGLDPEKVQVFVLGEQELIKLALDEEETMAREQHKVYGNVIRNKIASYKKMTPEAWLSKIQITLRPDDSAQTQKPAKPVDTGLSLMEEHLILPHLVVVDAASLAAFGYVITPPSEEAALEARQATHASSNYEICDRCSARFRIFPDREPETGRLTSNGPCRYHWAKKAFPQRQKTDSYTGGNEAYYPCCGQSIGTLGCTEHPDHVYKAASPARLAAVLPFEETPQNGPARKDKRGREIKAVVFDCEMGYTTNGLELIRLTAVSWPDAQPLVDVLVRPLGAIIDLNTRFSGVRPEHFVNAMPHSEAEQTANAHNESKSGALLVVPSPAAARKLLCEFLTQETPLIGHAIDNDLNAVRLCHPSIVDTVLLYRHPRGLPMRYGLKMLTKKYLDRDIQMGGDKGHDSHEDAVATGDLVRVKVADVWAELKTKGWKIEDGVLVAPNSHDAVEVGWTVVSNKKRKHHVPPAKSGNGIAALIKREGFGAGKDNGLTVKYLET